MDMVGAADGLTGRFNRNAESVIGQVRDAQKPGRLILIIGSFNIFRRVRQPAHGISLSASNSIKP